MMMRWRTSAVVVTLAVFVIGACDAHGAAVPTTSDATTAKTASPSDTASSSPVFNTTILSCTNSIGFLDQPPAGLQQVLGVVALDTFRTLQAAPSGQPGAKHAYFAKSGLLIRVGKSFELIVPNAWRDRVAIGWGSPGPITEHLGVPGCVSTTMHGWLAYPGGYWVAKPACVPLIVKTCQHAQTVHIAIGATCQTDSRG